MTKNPITMGIDEPFSCVWDKLRNNRIRHLPVIDKDRKVVGMVTQRDLYRIMSPRKTMDGNYVYDKAELDKFILKHVMRKKLILLSPEDTIGKAIDIMATTKYGCIPITDNKNILKGVITQIDVLKAIAKYFL